MYGGLISCVVLIIFSPVVSGKVDPATGASLSMIKDAGVDFHWFPLDNPGLVSIPLAFLLGWLGTVTQQAGGRPRRQVGRDAGPVDDRRRRREGGLALSLLSSIPPEASTRLGDRPGSRHLRTRAGPACCGRRRRRPPTVPARPFVAAPGPAGARPTGRR